MSRHKRETIPKTLRLVPDTLDSILQHFFAEIDEKNCKDYEPSSLPAMQSLTDRYLQELNYEYSIYIEHYILNIETCSILDFSKDLKDT